MAGKIYLCVHNCGGFGWRNSCEEAMREPDWWIPFLWCCCRHRLGRLGHSKLWNSRDATFYICKSAAQMLLYHHRDRSINPLKLQKKLTSHPCTLLRQSCQVASHATGARLLWQFYYTPSLHYAFNYCNMWFPAQQTRRSKASSSRVEEKLLRIILSLNCNTVTAYTTIVHFSLVLIR